MLLGHDAFKARLAARDASQALIGFDLDGTVVTVSKTSQQAAVAREMSSSMQAMTEAVGAISRNLGAVASSTRQIDAAARLVRDASRRMAG